MAHLPRIPAALLFAAASLAVASPVAAQEANCVDRGRLIDALQGKYGEHQRGLGLIDAQNALELHVGKDGAWTLILTKTNGVSCVVGTGIDWQDVPVTVTSLESYVNPAGFAAH